MSEREAELKLERRGAVLEITLDRPKVNAIDYELSRKINDAVVKLRDDPELRVGLLTAAGDRVFSAGWDLKAVNRGEQQLDEWWEADSDLPGGFAGLTEMWDLNKPVIAAVNGFAMGGGFMMVERTDLRVAVPDAVFEMSEAKRWLLGGYNHGHVASLPHPVATEMALGYRFNARRLHEVGFINRLAEPDKLIPTAMEMAEHMLTLPPAARVNTIYMMRQMRPQVTPDIVALADALHEHGDKSDRVESRAAFAEKRKPNWKGWLKPEDRYNMPTIESVRAGMEADD